MEEKPRTDFGYLKDGHYVPVTGADSRSAVVKHLKDEGIAGLHHVVQSKGFELVKVVMTATSETVDVDEPTNPPKGTFPPAPPIEEPDPDDVVNPILDTVE